MATKVLVVGAGLGGLRAAEALRGAGFEGAITVVGDEPAMPYNRPPLSKEALAGGVHVAELEFRRKPSVSDVDWRLGSPAIASDFAARTITLVPGDLLFSGTPAFSRPVQPGDIVEVEVEGLGILRNHIVEGPTPIRTDVGAQPSESEEVVSTALGGDWEFRGIRTPSKDLYPSRIEEE